MSAYKHIQYYRKLRKFSLREFSTLSGISASQLSKIESGKAKLTVDTALKLANILQVPASVFLTAPTPSAMARRSITRHGTGTIHLTPGMEFEILCSDFKEKYNLFWRVEITATSVEENGGWRQHPGQEFILVLEGRLELHSAHYEPTVLEKGDSILFDSDQSHAYVAVGGSAQVVMINSISHQG